MTNATALAAPRCVTGMPAYAGAATPAVTPGTTENGTPGEGSARLLTAPAEHERIPSLQTHDRPSNRTSRHQQLP